MSKPTNKPPVFHKPKWVKPLLLVTGLLVVLRLTGVIDIPKGWFVGAVVIEMALIVFEVTVFVVVIRYFYKQHRKSGRSKVEALTTAQFDELRSGGLPEKTAGPLEKAMLFEMNLYKMVYLFLRSLIRQNKPGLYYYLAISFGIAWISWIGGYLVFNVPPSNPRFILILLPGSLAPALAAIIVRKWVTREGFEDVGLRINRSAWRYYLLGWLWPLIGVGFILAALALLQSIHLLNLYPVIPTELSLSLPLVIVIQMLVAIPSAIMLLGEELGWRGYLQKQLYPHNRLKAYATTGLIWGVWHYPLIFIGYEPYDNPYLGMVVFTLFAVTFSIFLGWLYQTSKSIWVPSLAHSSSNIVGASILILLFEGQSNWFLWVSLLSCMPLALLSLYLITNRKLNEI